ncbi:MAG: T9SS type A sorting domain-containing protein [Bacteroidetes bacterium]|nr:T9SS type A sorting domain-containing protein [Bacteroidota bacterium]
MAKTIGGNMDDYLAGLSISPLGNIMITATSGSFKSAYKSENQKGFIKCITHVESFSDPACFVDKDFWTLKLSAEYCVPTPELCNTLDDNCNGLIDDDVMETISISAAGATEFCQGGSVILNATYSGTSVQWQKNGSNIPGAIAASYTATTKGNYACITTSDCSSATSEPIFVNVFKNPKAIISAAGPTTFCVGGSVTLNVSPVAGCSYQWYKDALLIPGATATNYLATTAGIYKCIVTKIVTGCFKNSAGIVINVPCKEGDEIIDNFDFSVYPNPANEFVNIQFNSDIYNNEIVAVFDATGKKHFTSVVTDDQAQINITILAQGLYLVKLVSSKESQTKSFIKQ